MTRQDFDRLVRSVENGVGRNPAALRWRVILFALLGYGLLLAGLFGVALVAAGFFAVMYWADLQGKIICGVLGSVILFGGGWAVLRALLVRLRPPEGVPVTRGQAPALFTMLDELRAELHCIPFHHIQLIPENNAAVVQVPRLGVLGWSRNFLLLGMPLLEAHSAPEIRGILAHEFAHLSRQHGRVSHWIYRLRRSWESIFAQLSQERAEVSFRKLMLRVFNSFWPRFNAHAFVFSRATEYEADSVAARVAGAEHIGAALIRLAVQDRWLDQDFWPEFWRRVNTEPDPPADVLLRLRDALRREPATEKTAKWFAEALRVPTTNGDTHPCLADRLRALQWLPPDFVSPGSGPNSTGPPATSSLGMEWLASRGIASLAAPRPSAAEALLGAELDPLRAQVAALWQKDIKPRWEMRHAKAGALAHRLSALEQALPASGTDVDALWDKAALLLDLKGEETAEPVLRQILAAKPDHLAAHFHLGRILLEQGHAEGESHLERVMAEDEDSLPQACALLREHARRAGRLDRMREIELRLDRYEKDLQASRIERREVTARDKLIAHGLSAEELGALTEILKGELTLARAELGQKALQYFPKQKLFLLCVYPRKPWYGLGGADRAQALVGRLSKTVRLPGRVLVFGATTGFRPLARKLAKVPGAEVFRRS